MIKRHAIGAGVWIDVEAPSPEEIRELLAQYRIDSRIEDEVIAPIPYPLFVPFPEYLYLVLHFPVTMAAGGTKNQEIDFIVGKDFLITIRYEPIAALIALDKAFEADELVGTHEKALSIPAFLERVFRRLYGALGVEVDQTAERLERIEKAIFSGRERATVRAISEVGRTLIRFETALIRHKEPLDALVSELSLPTFFSESFTEHGAHIKAERSHAANLVSSYRAVATELRDTNDSILSTSQNEVMKTLTVVTFIVFPLSLIAALFQMNLPGTPLLGEPHAFWIVLGAMVVFTGFLALFVVRRGWL